MKSLRKNFKCLCRDYLVKSLFTKTYGNILAFFLTLLGFSPIISSCAKYGVPCTYIKPQVTGSVVSYENKVPIQGIRAVLKDDYQGYDTAYTAKNGGFFLQYPYTICSEGRLYFRVELKDVDGELNGLFEDMEITVDSESKQNLGTIQMTSKE